MKWIPAYATGVEQIDAQHRTLFRAAEDFEEAVSAGQGEHSYDSVLDFLDRYARAHFGFEENCMARFVCPAAEANKAAHTKFIELVQDFRERYRREGYRSSTATELVESVNHWLANHIVTIDVRLRDHVIASSTARHGPPG